MAKMLYDSREHCRGCGQIGAGFIVAGRVLGESSPTKGEGHEGEGGVSVVQRET